MMTPTKGDKIFNTDIETGKILNEWSFQKDGMDVEMRVRVNPANWLCTNETNDCPLDLLDAKIRQPRVNPFTRHRSCIRG